MKKFVLILLTVVMIVSVFVSCAKVPEVTPQPTQTANETKTPIETNAPDATTEVVNDGAPTDMSPTTGLPGNPNYKPVIVQIENEPPARPQAGIQVADIVYETMIEAEATRFTCIFNDTYPDEAGPVRSSRYYHQWIQQEWDAIYVHQGGPDDPNFKTTYIYGDSGNHIKQRINGVKGAPEELLYRKKNTGKIVEHTAYTNVPKVLAAYNYEPTKREPFKYYPLASYDEYPEIDTIQLSFWRRPDFLEYKYDKEKDKLIRYMGGKEFIAAETEKPLEVQNLIVQYASISEAPGEGGRKFVNVFGEGPAEYILHGKHLKGTWSRPEGSTLTKYYLENGEEVTLTPGNTWITVHPNDKNLKVKYANGEEYSVN